MITLKPVWILLLTVALTACGSDSDSDSDSDPDPDVPLIPVPLVPISPIDPELQAFNLTAITVEDDNFLLFEWGSASGGAEGVTYTLCETDESETDNCNSLAEVVDETEVTIQWEGLLVDLIDNDFFVLAKTFSSDLDSSEAALNNVEVNELINYIKASDTQSNAKFGGSISLSSDGTTLAVGTDFFDNGEDDVDVADVDVADVDKAHVNLYRFEDGSWEELFSFYDNIVTTVSLSSDGNTLVIGANNDSEGSVSLYRFEDNSWEREEYQFDINAPIAVSLSSDGNTLAVAEGDTVTVYRFEFGAWDEYLDPISIDNNTVIAVSLSSDGTTLAAAFFTYAVNLYRVENAAWTRPSYVVYDGAKITAFSLSSDGNTLALSHYDGDSDDDAYTESIVSLYRFEGVAWLLQQTIFPLVPDDYFGRSVSLSSDGNTLAVGAPYESSTATGIDGDQYNNDANHSGAVYLFRFEEDSWLLQGYIKASNTDAADYFGQSVSLSSDGNTLAVGAIGESSNATGIDGDQDNNNVSQSGAVYIY